MRKKDLMRLLEERQERVELLMKRVESTENLLQTYQKREQSVVDAMAAARTAADQLIGEAAKRAEEMVRSAHVQAEALLEKARAESESLKKRTEISMAEYQETILAYNRLIEDSAAEAIRSTNRYAELLKSRKLTPSEEYTLRPAGERPHLQDATDNPAKLMQNIYELQNRDIPEIREIPGLFGRAESPAPERAAVRPVPDEEDVARPVEIPFLSEQGEADMPLQEQSPKEEGTLPRVQQFVAENAGAGDGGISLDDLLDEIIEAGDQ